MSVGNGFVGHLLDCRSALSAMQYDPHCVRCSAIKKVVMLRRKTQSNGCPEDEESAAQTSSDALVAKYGLTRGEVYDRLYVTRQVEIPTQKEYKEDVVWATRKTRRPGRPVFADIEEIG